MNWKRPFTGTKVLTYITLVLMFLSFLSSDAEAGTFDHYKQTEAAPPVEITEQDVKFAKEKVALGMRTLDDYWEQVFKNSRMPYSSPDVYYYYRPVETDCGVIPMENAVFCGRDNSIYFDIYFFTRMMKAVGNELGTDGDMAVITVLAHEWGHSVQAQTNNFWRLPMLNELGADCFAGAFVGNADRLGYIEHGDSEEALLTLAVGGDDAPWYAPGAHGSPSRRMNSFKEGFNHGLAPCQAG
jgi:uncharacterized protein